MLGQDYLAYTLKEDLTKKKKWYTICIKKQTYKAFKSLERIVSRWQILLSH